MATMYPKSIDLYEPTESERTFFNALKEQLDDRIQVYYSVSWTEIRDGQRKTSETDFLIFDPRYGYLTIEVKGGTGIRVDNNNWFLEYNNEDGGRRLSRSPYIQAEESMYYFRNYFQDQYHFKFGGVSGAMVCFPNFSITNAEELSNRPKEMTISYLDMSNLSMKIKEAFVFWKNRYTSTVSFTTNQQQQFKRLINKRIQISAACGALIDYQKPQFDIINRVQDNYVYFLKNYRQFFISGGAGTGKTWVALKFIDDYMKNGLNILFTCMNPYLIEFFKNKIGQQPNVDILSFKELLVNNDIIDTNDDYINNNVLDKTTVTTHKKYDAIVIDEAQDFNFECALTIVEFLRDSELSRLNVFFDKTQNIFDRDFQEGFAIKTPAFCLRENLRNTSKIYEWATEHTDFETDVITNPIEGTDPIQIEFVNNENCINRISMILNELINQEGVDSSSITLLVDDFSKEIFDNLHIADWKLVHDIAPNNGIKFFTVSEYKGLESDVIIYVYSKRNSDVADYVAYTRARYFLYDLIFN